MSRIPLDLHGRPLRNLRISVTDRCNLRCSYCMPEAEYTWLPRGDLLSFEEIATLVEVFLGIGVDKIRLTGGEPLLRKNLDQLVASLATKPGLSDLALTTNGVHLAEQARILKRAGLHRITVSLDTLRPERFSALTRSGDHARVIQGIDVAVDVGFQGLKLDTVLLRGTNDDEIEPLLDFAEARGAELRFIEYMDVGGATQWKPELVVSRDEILARLRERRGSITPLAKTTSAPADRFAFADGTTFGIISSTTAPFCGSCDRSRLTADGNWFLCLYSGTGTNLRDALRSGCSNHDLSEMIRVVWTARTDRGAEQRLRELERGPLTGREVLRHNPHLEMHTKGG